MCSLLDYINALENKILFIIKLKRKQIKLMSFIWIGWSTWSSRLCPQILLFRKTPKKNTSMRHPSLFFVLLSIYITKRYTHFKEKPPDSMKIPNTSETRNCKPHTTLQVMPSRNQRLAQECLCFNKKYKGPPTINKCLFKPQTHVSLPRE